MMRASIIGYGSSGKAAEALLKDFGMECLIDGIEVPFDFAVISPGVPLTDVRIKKLVATGIPLKSELQLGCEELKNRGWKLLAVTGSKGKSSVVKLCAEALKGIPCGNFGRPVCDVALKESPGWAVVEVSSFQMETTNLPTDTFEAAAILNLQEDHLDRHGSVETYHALKRKLLNSAKVKVFPGAESARELYAGSYFDNSVLCANADSAVALLRAAGLSDAEIRGAFAAFKPLSHRFEVVAEINGVRYIDDSKATSLKALVAGVEMAGERVRLIAGGLPKGDNPMDALKYLTKRVQKVYLIGTCADAFMAAWGKSVECEICGTLYQAVMKVKRESVPGETVLLSPGTASFDQFKSFEERGEVFARLVKKEG